MTIILDRPLFYLNHRRSRPLLFIPPFKGIIMVVTVAVKSFAQYGGVRPGFNLKRVLKRRKKRLVINNSENGGRDDKPA